MQEAYSTTLFLLLSFLPSKPNNKKLPRGPRRLPLIGNLAQINRHRPHVDMADLARVHGPLLSLRLGTELVVIASSPASAMEFFKTHDKKLSSRFVPHTFRLEEYSPNSLAQDSRNSLAQALFFSLCLKQPSRISPLASLISISFVKDRYKMIVFYRSS